MCLSGKLFGKMWSLVPRPSIRSKSPHMTVFGFGADLPQTNDYKLVRLVYHKNDMVGYNKYSGLPEIEIYSINSGVWRRVVGFEIQHCIVEIMSSPVFVNGFVHWIIYDYVANGGRRRILIMTFNIANEVFGEIMLPDAIIGGTMTSLLVTLFEESLAIVRYGMRMGMYGYFCQVWVMKQYGVSESWNRLCHINLVAGFKKVV
ncbi:F-box/kelch-repeat protein At3g06240-like [Solanum lycopersicum]|nr:F-box/kelch-repeat protein At3g06240-like [Solanum lycopersicum]